MGISRRDLAVCNAYSKFMGSARPELQDAYWEWCNANPEGWPTDCPAYKQFMKELEQSLHPEKG